MRVLHTVVHAISSVFSCQHDRMTRPFTIQQQSYMVCLECGQKVFYSMEAMRRLSRREVRRLLAADQGQLQTTAVNSLRHATLPSAKPESKFDPTLAA